MEGIVKAWGSILVGRAPCLSIEITRECPLSCPGCYAFATNHLGTGVGLASASDFRGDELVGRVLQLVDLHRPVQVSLVGGEPLVRYRELGQLLPALASRGIYTQLVTSAVRPIPFEWRSVPRLQIVVSVDGLQPEHDARRRPATYERILSHLGDHRVTVHWTITRQQAQRPGYLEQFVTYWSRVPQAQRIWVSLYTPQIGERSEEQLTSEDRRVVVAELMRLVQKYPALEVRRGALNAFVLPPVSPDECVFAQTTTCFTSDLATRVTPCQLGGTPDCAQCGCLAAAAFTAVARHRLPLGVRVGDILRWSTSVGRVIGRARRIFADAPMPNSGAERA